MEIANCPKCHQKLAKKSFADELAYYQCTNCAGLVMTEASFRSLKKAWLSETVIDPPPFSSARRNQDNVINCPSCSLAMSMHRDPVQSHVCLDYCASCELLYFDAGEFTDIKQLTLMDHIWSFIARIKQRD